MRKNISAVLALALAISFLSVPVVAFDASSPGSTQTICVGGSDCSAAIDPSGTLWMWGYNFAGEFGNGLMTDSVNENGTLFQATPLRIIDNVISVCTNGKSTAIIKTDGSLWTCGCNWYGELGFSGGNDQNGSTPIQTTFAKVMDNVTAVSCGDKFMAAVKSDGSLWTWGINREGQLGNGQSGYDSKGTPKYSDKPVKIMDDAVAVSCGENNTAAIKKDGSLWVWGVDLFSTNHTITEVCPSPVKAMDNVSSVCCGDDYIMVIKTDHTLWTWGTNAYGRMGNGEAGNDGSSTSFIEKPVMVMQDVSAVSCNTYNAAAIKTDGSLWVWGDNGHAQLGQGDFSYTYTTSPFKLLNGVAAVSCGLESMAAVMTDGSLYTWGFNGYSGGMLLGYTGGDRTKNDWFNTIRYYQTTPRLVPGIEVKLTDKVPASQTSTRFNDVEDGAYYADAVKWAVEKGVTNGTSATMFSPNRKCTFAEMVTMLWRAYGSPQPTGTCAYTNLTAESPYYSGFCWASGIGIFNGNDTASYDSPCTRATTVLYMWRAAGKPAIGSTNGFADMDYNAEHQSAVDWAVSNGITYGTSSTQFSPFKTCTRAEIVTFLYRGLGKK